jgi:uncharacterized UPF0160 family protein
MSKKRLVTHNGSFHADDLFAAATLSLYLDKKGLDYEIVRTRDMEVIKNADYVFDVGGIYDPNINRFDHHQKNGSGIRENGIPYAAFGLVWKHFGMDLCENDKEVWEIIDREIASPIDANDNGVDIVSLKFNNIKPYMGSRVFSIFEPTWQETENHIDQIFKDQVIKIKEVLKREIKVAKDDALGMHILEKAYQDTENKKIIILEQSLPRYLYQQFLSSYKEPMYLILPSEHSESYKVEAISISPQTMKSRLPFPEKWRGFIYNENNKEHTSKIPGVYFVHNSGFLANLNNKENQVNIFKT